MTTPPIVSITDELIAELERNLSELHDPAEFGDKVVRTAQTILALLAERAELKRDAERRRWVPISERAPVYPDKGRCYVMGVQRGHPYPFPVRYTPSKWEYMDGDTCRGLTHWMPMPDLPMAAQ